MTQQETPAPENRAGALDSWVSPGVVRRCDSLTGRRISLPRPRQERRSGSPSFILPSARKPDGDLLRGSSPGDGQAEKGEPTIRAPRSRASCTVAREDGGSHGSRTSKSGGDCRAHVRLQGHGRVVGHTRKSGSSPESDQRRGPDHRRALRFPEEGFYARLEGPPGAKDDSAARAITESRVSLAFRTQILRPETSSAAGCGQGVPRSLSDD